MSTAGPLTPSSGVDDSGVGTRTWTSPGNVNASDDSRALCFFSAIPQISHYILATNFGFTIPTDATINGIQVSVERHATSATAIKDYIVSLIKGGSIGATNNAHNTFWQSPSTDFVDNYGSVSDLWGDTWSPSDINASNFGVAFACQAPSDGDTGQAEVDVITVTVTYTDATPITDEAVYRHNVTPLRWR